MHGRPERDDCLVWPLTVALVTVRSVVVGQWRLTERLPVAHIGSIMASEQRALPTFRRA